MEKWFEYYLSFTIGNLKWWRNWFSEKLVTPEPEIMALIDRLLPIVEAAIESCRPTPSAADVCHESPSKTHSWYGSTSGYVCEHCGTRR